MQGSLCLHRGVLWVGRHEKTAHVRAFDLEGNPLTDGFSFRDPRLGRSMAAGLAVDDDRNLWVADPPASRIRRFSAFGVEIGGLGLAPDAAPEAAAEEDTAGLVRSPVDVVVRGDADGMLLVAASGGVRRHAVQLFSGDGRLLESLRPLGDPRGRFQGVRGVALEGRYLFVAEREGGRVQVFRDADHHFCFHGRDCGWEPFLPNGVAAVGDGRILVANGGAKSALLLFDAAGRLLRPIARTGRGEGQVFEPDAVVVQRAERDDRSRVAVIDADGSRVQAFDLEGRPLGVLHELAS